MARMPFYGTSMRNGPSLVACNPQGRKFFIHPRTKPDGSVVLSTLALNQWPILFGPAIGFAAIGLYAFLTRVTGPSGTTFVWTVIFGLAGAWTLCALLLLGCFDQITIPPGAKGCEWIGRRAWMLVYATDMPLSDLKLTRFLGFPRAGGPRSEHFGVAVFAPGHCAALSFTPWTRDVESHLKELASVFCVEPESNVATMSFSYWPVPAPPER